MPLHSHSLARFDVCHWQAWLLLSACAGGYQAPISEQGERQVLTAPIIVDSSTPDSSFRLENSGPARVLPVRWLVVRGQPAQRRVRSAALLNPGGAKYCRSSTPRIHRVQPGDTLFSIAFQYDLDFRSLAIANGLNPPYTIFVDREINLDLNNIVAMAPACRRRILVPLSLIIPLPGRGQGARLRARCCGSRCRERR